MKKLVLLAFFSIFIQQCLWAQIKDTMRIEEVTIIDSLKKPSNVIVVDKTKQFNKSTSELLISEPGVTLVKRSVFAEEPVINAFKYDQLNIIKNDGAKASSSCPNRMDPATTRISPNEISKIEIAKGPYEVRYGQIMGGLVRFISDEPVIYDKFTVKGTVGGEYQTNGNGMTTALNIDGGSKLFDFKSFANYRKFDNYKSGDGTEIASSFKTYGFGFAGAMNINKKQRITADWSFSQANDVLHAGLPMDADFDQSNMLALDYLYSDISPLIKHLKVKIYAAAEDHLMSNANRPNAHLTTAYTPVISENYGARMELKLEASKAVKFFVGSDFNHIRKDGTKEATVYKNVCTSPPTVLPKPKELEFSVWQNSYLQDLGVFTQVKYFINRDFVFDGGIRMDFIKSDILDPEKDFTALYGKAIQPDDELNFNYFGKLQYQVPGNIELEFALGRGTRNASLLEKYINHFTVGLDSYEYVGSPHLESEVNHQVDLRVSKKHKVFYAFVNVFYSRVQNYITAEVDTTISKKFVSCKPPLNAKRFVNIDEVEQYGISVGSKIQMTKHFYSQISASYVYAQNMAWDEPLAETPPFSAFITLGYKTKKWMAELSNQFQSEQTRVASSVGEQTSPAFYLLNLNASYKVIKNLKLGFSVNNLLNDNYYQHLSRPYKNMEVDSPFYETGRNFKVLVQYSF